MPGAPLPLHIFEPRYRQLTVDLVTGVVPDKQFGVVAVREGWSTGDDPTTRPAACTASAARPSCSTSAGCPTAGSTSSRAASAASGSCDVDAEARPYLMGEVEYLPDQPDAARRTTCPPSPPPPAPRTAATAPRRGRAATGPSRPTTSGPAELAHLLAADCLLPDVRPPAPAGADLPGDPAAHGARAADPGGGAPAPAPRRPGPACTRTRWSTAPTDPPPPRVPRPARRVLRRPRVPRAARVELGAIRRRSAPAVAATAARRPTRSNRRSSSTAPSRRISCSPTSITRSSRTYDGRPCAVPRAGADPDPVPVVGALGLAGQHQPDEVAPLAPDHQHRPVLAAAVVLLERHPRPDDLARVRGAVEVGRVGDAPGAVARPARCGHRRRRARSTGSAARRRAERPLAVPASAASAA